MILPAAARAHRLAQVNFTGAPAFTRLLWNFMPYWYVPPLIAAVYCAIVWTRKSGKYSWFAFFSVATAFLFIWLIPILIANQLPLIDFLNNIPTKTFEAAH